MKQEDDNLRVSEKLSEDLKALFRPPQADLTAADRAIMDQAAQRLLLVRRGRRFFWPAAAAAAILLGIFLLQHWDPGRQIPSSKPILSAAQDVDQNGSVDILDAFQLAKRVQSSSASDARWDLNQDGVIDHADVDMIAQTAVTLRKDVL